MRRELAPGGDILTLVKELVASDLESALLVGHEPSSSEFISAMVGAEIWSESLSKGMSVAIRVAAEGKAKPLFTLDSKRLEPVPL